MSDRTKRDANTTSETNDSTTVNQGNTILNAISGFDVNSVIQQIGFDPVAVSKKVINYFPGRSS